MQNHSLVEGLGWMEWPPEYWRHLEELKALDQVKKVEVYRAQRNKLTFAWCILYMPWKSEAISPAINLLFNCIDVWSYSIHENHVDGTNSNIFLKDSFSIVMHNGDETFEVFSKGKDSIAFFFGPLFRFAWRFSRAHG